MTKDFDARNEKKSRSVCAAMAESADTDKRVLSEKERRILDMWPRYDDGEPVWFGDGAAVNVGNIAIEAIEFTDGCAYVKDGACGDYNTLVQVFKHVKRPAPEVLDADGVEIKVGDTVWHEDGSELHVIGFGDAQNGETMLAVEYAAGPTKWGEVRCLSVTHTRPAPKVLDADGVEIEVGDRIYSIETGNSYTVRSINGSGTIEFNGFNDKGWSPKYFMHMQPTIDADGVLIKVGDTVWHHSGFAHGVVTSIDAGSLMGTVRYVNGGVEFRDAAKDLTHACPDSWERLEEDAVKVVCEYAGAVPDEFGDYDCDTCRLFDARGNLICEQQMALDIVRRAKAIAGVEVDG